MFTKSVWKQKVRKFEKKDNNKEDTFLFQIYVIPSLKVSEHLIRTANSKMILYFEGVLQNFNLKASITFMISND